MSQDKVDIEEHTYGFISFMHVPKHAYEILLAGWWYTVDIVEGSWTELVYPVAARRKTSHIQNTLFSSKEIQFPTSFR